MGKSSYQKFMKKEKAKVKLRNKKKELLPKGQNVTDLNFKVKKIILKTQLKDHDSDAVVSKRNLNVKEVLSRLGHHNNHAQIEALADLDGIINNPQVDYASNLMAIVNQLGKSVVSSSSDSRKKSTAVLVKILSQLRDSQEGALACAALIPRLACGLTSLDAGIRSHAVSAAAVICASCPVGTAPALPVLLPTLLGLLAVRSGTSWVPATPPLTQSPISWRSRIIATVTLLLENYTSHSSNIKETKMTGDTDLENKNIYQVSCQPRFLRPTDETQLDLGFCNSAALVPQSKNDWKEETDILVLVTLDLLAEAIADCDADFNGPVISKEICDLLENAAGMLIGLRNLLIQEDSPNEHWFTTQFGRAIHSRLISDKFPYRVKVKKAKGRHQSSPGQDCTVAQKANARIALLGLSVALTEMHRKSITKHLSSIASSQSEFAKALLIAVQIDPACLKYIGPDTLKAIARDPTLDHLHQEPLFVNWLSKLVANINNCSKEDLSILLHLASMSRESVLNALNQNINSILETLRLLPQAREVIKLLYYVQIWDEKLLDSLQILCDGNEFLHRSIIDIVHARSRNYIELRRLLTNHTWWSKRIEAV